jgi:NAD+ synthase (glutamine-hydrolysing)
VQQGASVQQTIDAGYNEKLVRWVSRAIAINEYKRRQAAPVLKVTPKAFGSGRRFPIAARYER